MARTLKVPRNETEYRDALEWVEELMDSVPGSPESETLDVLSILIERYEDEHYPIDLPDPVSALKFRMDQAGLSQQDLVPYIGSKSKVSEILSRKRELTLGMIRALHQHL